jgi:hypothetical protein
MFLPALPALGEAILKQIFTNEEIGRFVRLGLNIAVQAVSADAELEALNAEIEAMVAEGRAPNEAEWAKYDAMVDDALARAKAAVEAGEQTA